jgi:hypothetical protein
MPRSRSDPISEEAVLIDFYFFGQNVFVAFFGLSFDPSPAVLDRMRAAIV